MTEKYIGDGVYVYGDGWHVVLKTERENGTNIIYLEPFMLVELCQFAKEIGLLRINELKKVIE